MQSIIVRRSVSFQPRLLNIFTLQTNSFTTNNLRNKENIEVFYDFRSDVKSIPTPAMREAMSTAIVGDDSSGEDPTVNELQERMANMLRKEAALFVSSGTMGNLISCMVHCPQRFSEVILGHQSHINLSEGVGISWIGSMHASVINNQENGTLDMNDIRSRIRFNSEDAFQPKTRLICLENTHNRCGGLCLSLEYTNAVSKLRNEISLELGHKINMHLDGARLFNAATATDNININVQQNIHQLVKDFDSVSVCFSKGLGSPVGSIVAGDQSFINECKLYRRALGGNMRQAGVLAACCLISLDEIIPLLKKDHEMCAAVYQQMNELQIRGIKIHEPETNILMFEITPSEFVFDNEKEFIAYMKINHRLMFHRWEENIFRFVFHHQNINQETIEALINAFRDLKGKQK